MRRAAPSPNPDAAPLPARPPVWRWQDGDVDVAFVGRGAISRRDRPRGDALRDAAAIAFDAPATPIAWLDQVHGRAVIDLDDARARDRAEPPPLGDAACGPADALVTAQADLTLAIVTADCVPVVLRAGPAIAAVHAGWRGIAAGVVPAAMRRLVRRARAAAPDRKGDTPLAVDAWIGPAIAAAAYEVSDDVAAAVADAVPARDRAALTAPGPRGRPMLDLIAAVRA
ncbi:MAG: polyphenol oxidase family protein, partial [Acidobacteriota bacterium]